MGTCMSHDEESGSSVPHYVRKREAEDKTAAEEPQEVKGEIIEINVMLKDGSPDGTQQVCVQVRQLEQIGQSLSRALAREFEVNYCAVTEVSLRPKTPMFLRYATYAISHTAVCNLNQLRLSCYRLQLTFAGIALELSDTWLVRP